jgi:hypothetical protein
VWKLIFRQGAGVDWFSQDDMKRHPCTHFGYGEGHHGKCSRLDYILEFMGVQNKFVRHNLCMIDCINYMNQTEGNVVHEEECPDFDDAWLTDDTWLRRYLARPSPTMMPRSGWSG